MADRRTITREQFIVRWIENNPDFTRHPAKDGTLLDGPDCEYVVLPCECGDDLCQGWATLPSGRTADMHLKLYGSREGGDG